MSKKPLPEPSNFPRLNDSGWEVPDSQPVAIPAGFKRPETLAEQVQRLVRRSISEHAAAQGMETFEEADDFDVGDDFDPSTPYETFFDPVLQREVTPQEFRDRGDHYRQQYARAHKEYFDRVDRDGVLAENLLRRAVSRDRDFASQRHSSENGGVQGGTRPPAPSSEGPTGTSSNDK